MITGNPAIRSRDIGADLVDISTDLAGIGTDKDDTAEIVTDGVSTMKLLSRMVADKSAS